MVVSLCLLHSSEEKVLQNFRDYINSLLWEYSKEVYSTETPDQITLEELIDSHRDIRKARIVTRETYRDGYSAGYTDAKSRYSIDNWIEISELRGMTIDELIEFLKNKESD